MKTRDRTAFLLAVACMPALIGCREEPPPPPEAPRPVRVVTLETIDPIKPLQISGSVRSWNEQDVAFEVSAPVSFIVEETTNLEGRWIENGKQVDEGQVLGQLNEREFIINRDAAQASLDVATADVELARTQLADLLPARLRAAEANQTRASAELERFVKALETNAVAKLDVIRHQADLDQRKAETDEAKAAIESKKVEIQSLEARIEQANSNLAKAKYDLDRCKLWAPFTGEVSDVFVESGGYATAGEPVAHLVMMDPIKVDVAVSAQRATQLRLGDQVKLKPLAGGEAYGKVYEKATAADPSTRTFRVSILARNARVITGLPSDSPHRSLPRIEIYSRVQRIDHAFADSLLVVEERKALRKDDQGDFVWATDELPRGQSLDPKRPVLSFRKVRVVRGDLRRNFQGLFVAQTLADPGELTEDWVVAHDPPKDFNGGDMLIAIRDWQLRPGQIVPTFLGGQVPRPGLYVPMRAITLTRDKRKSVFVEQDGIARRVIVNLVDVVAELVRAEPAEEAGAALLKDGSHVIVDSVHFLQDGEPVRVVQTSELVP